MKLAKVEGKTDLEKQYYMGLAHYRLSEIEQAQTQFQAVAEAKDPTLSPSALFYVGVIQFSQEKYEDAKKAFEGVIDTSQDPKLDDQAEQYLDRIASAIQFQKLRENKWTLTGTLGLMYDSNVLLSPDNQSDQGEDTGIADFRLLTIADAEYRPIYNENHELSAKANASLTNSAKEEAAHADPFLYTFSLPYSYKGVVWKKGYKFTAKPAYEMLYMAPTEATKHLTFTSYYLSLDNTFVMSNQWFSTYSFEYRLDDSRETSSTGPNDADSTRYALRASQMLFLDKSKKEAMLGNFGYVLNAAKGDNKNYGRIELGATYVRPVRWNASWNLGLSLYQLTYPNAEENSTDFNTTLSTGITKPIREW
ncbi:MAG: hypothetical protein HC902_13400 [Calothrix sp. SM1_5_4]|nr:hypothetical protein [Calothrix sp. SM1_5_4]